MNNYWTRLNELDNTRKFFFLKICLRNFSAWSKLLKQLMSYYPIPNVFLTSSSLLRSLNSSFDDTGVYWFNISCFIYSGSIPFGFGFCFFFKLLKLWLGIPKLFCSFIMSNCFYSIIFSCYSTFTRSLSFLLFIKNSCIVCSFIICSDMFLNEYSSAFLIFMYTSSSSTSILLCLLVKYTFNSYSCYSAAY